MLKRKAMSFLSNWIKTKKKVSHNYIATIYGSIHIIKTEINPTALNVVKKQRLSAVEMPKPGKIGQILHSTALNVIKKQRLSAVEQRMSL